MVKKQIYNFQDNRLQREIENIYQEIVSSGSTGVVTTVFGRDGDVLAQVGDYSWAQIDKDSSDIADITDRSHTDLQNIGTNTHPQIDTHIADITGNPHGITAEMIDALSSVSVDGTTITGSGTVADPIGIDLTNANTWTETQTFTDNITVSGAGETVLAGGTVALLDSDSNLGLVVEDGQVFVNYGFDDVDFIVNNASTGQALAFDAGGDDLSLDPGTLKLFNATGGGADVDGISTGVADNDKLVTQGYVDDAVEAGGGGSGETVVTTITQANTFSDGDVVYNNAGTWTLAKADDADTLATNMVINTSASDFDLVSIGKVTVTTHGFGTAGQILYTSSTVAGGLVTTEPTGYSNPIGIVIDTNTITIFPWRASATNGPISTTVTASDMCRMYSGTVTITGGGGDVTVDLPFDWTDGYITVHISRTATNYFDGGSVENTRTSSYEAINNTSYTSNQNITQTSTTNPANAKTDNYPAIIKSATATSFTLHDSGTTVYVKYFVWTPADIDIAITQNDDTTTTTSGAGAPTSTPVAIGDTYIDTGTPMFWYAVGTSSVADWYNLNGASADIATIFSDDFDRADGVLSNGWATYGTLPVVDTNKWRFNGYAGYGGRSSGVSKHLADFSSYINTTSMIIISGKMNHSQTGGGDWNSRQTVGIGQNTTPTNSDRYWTNSNTGLYFQFDYELDKMIIGDIDGVLLNATETMWNTTNILGWEIQISGRTADVYLWDITAGGSKPASPTHTITKGADWNTTNETNVYLHAGTNCLSGGTSHHLEFDDFSMVGQG